MAASNMAMPGMKPYLDYLLENGAAKHVTVRWGQSYRKVIIIGGKQYQYKGGDNINRNLENTIVPLYISMSSKPSKQNTNTIKDDAATKIQKLYKANKQTLNKEHAIQVIFNIRFMNEQNHRTYRHIRSHSQLPSLIYCQLQEQFYDICLKAPLEAYLEHEIECFLQSNLEKYFQKNH